MESTTVALIGVRRIQAGGQRLDLVSQAVQKYRWIDGPPFAVMNLM
jgi:hypothetical protein